MGGVGNHSPSYSIKRHYYYRISATISISFLFFPLNLLFDWINFNSLSICLNSSLRVAICDSFSSILSFGAASLLIIDTKSGALLQSAFDMYYCGRNVSQLMQVLLIQPERCQSPVGAAKCVRQIALWHFTIELVLIFFPSQDLTSSILLQHIYPVLLNCSSSY